MKQGFRTSNGRIANKRYNRELINPVLTTDGHKGLGYSDEMVMTQPIADFLVSSRNKSVRLGKPVEIPSRPYYVDFSRPVNEKPMMSYVV